MPEFNFYADSARGYKEKAKELRKSLRYDEAAEVLRVGLEQFPDDAYLLNEMGRHLRSKWRDDEALEYFERAYSQRPDDVYIACDYADFLNKQGRADDAEIVYLHSFDDKVKGYSRPNQFVLVGLGNLYQTTERYQFAAVCFGEACERNREDEVAHRRYFEVVRNYPVKTDDHAQEWTKFMAHAQDVIDEAGDPPRPPSDEPTPAP